MNAAPPLPAVQTTGLTRTYGTMTALRPGVQEVSIGHALIADALELGYIETVREYQRCIQRAYTG